MQEQNRGSQREAERALNPQKVNQKNQKIENKAFISYLVQRGNYLREGEEEDEEFENTLWT